MLRTDVRRFGKNDEGVAGMTNRRPQRGFTIAELLVVVLVIAVLVTLLIPVLVRAREQARRSTCASNLSNMVKCCHLYSDALPNLGMFPMYGTDPNANGLKSLNLLY
jgi:prepilin-type N-terminal cleavage/methylation domain-containing protein